MHARMEVGRFRPAMRILHDGYCWSAQGNTPEPTSDKVKVVEVPGGRGYTRQFSGFATGAAALLAGSRDQPIGQLVLMSMSRSA